MLPRDSWDGFKLNSTTDPRPPQAVRKTIRQTTYTERVNPWIAIHNGSIVDNAGLLQWEKTIPAYGCACRQFYQAWKAANAPDYSSPEAFFAWGVRLHNAVNAKLGKPEITIDEAYSIWRKSDGLETETNLEQRP
jgi:hypothetical protein